MTDADAPVRIERDGDVAVVVFDSPPLNLFDPPMFNALENVAAELLADERIVEAYLGIEGGAAG